MMKAKLSSFVAAVVFGVVLVVSTTAAADDEEPVRVVVVEVDEQSHRAINNVIADMDGFEVVAYSEFVDAVSDRAFTLDGITENPSDLQWVMDGSNLSLIIDLVEEDDEDYRVKFITDEEAKVEHEFLADRGRDGSIRRGGAAVIRFELEEFFDLRGVAAAPERDTETTGETAEDDEEPEQAITDPDALREQAAREQEERREAFSDQWLWLRAHARLFQKNLSVAARQTVFTYDSGGYFGGEVDVEAFPLAPVNPDMYQMGFYATYNHGMYGLTIIEERGDEQTEHDLSVNSLTVEGGALYRLDSPLEDSNRQLRIKLGARYDSFSVDENPRIPSTANVALIAGTRLVLPMMTDEFALTASVDVAPLAMFTTGEELFGEESLSFGFGSELGALFEMFDNGFLSAGYTFRMMRTNFEGEGEPLGDEDDDQLVFVDSEAFDLNHGVRAGFVYQF